MDISIVIPNYNGASLLTRNVPRLMSVLEKIKKTTKYKIEVIIVDDCSTDTSKNTIESLLQTYKTHAVSLRSFLKSVNQGFSPTVNFGAKEATGEFLVLLNSDAYPEDDFLTPALEHFKNSEVFAVGFMDKSIEDGTTILRGRGVGKWERGFLVHKRGEVDASDTLWVNGGSSVYRKSVWDKLGGLIELYAPYYWEDIDISYRAEKAGYTLVFEKKSIVIHEHEEGAIKKTQPKKRVQIIAFRNQIFFSWINMSDTKLILAHVWWLPYHIVNTLRTGDNAFVLALLKAVFSLPVVLSKRRSVQQMVKRSDASVTQLYIRHMP